AAVDRVVPVPTEDAQLLGRHVDEARRPGQGNAGGRCIGSDPDRIVAVAPEHRSGVSPVTAVEVNGERLGSGAGELGAACEALDGEAVGRLRSGDLRRSSQAADASAVDGNVVRGGSSVDDDLVGLAVGSAVVDVDGVDVGAGEVVDGGGVGASEGFDVHEL